MGKKDKFHWETKKRNKRKKKCIQPLNIRLYISQPPRNKKGKKNLRYRSKIYRAHSIKSLYYFCKNVN